MTILQLVQSQITRGWFHQSARSESDVIIAELADIDRRTIEIQMRQRETSSQNGYDLLVAIVPTDSGSKEIMSVSELQNWFSEPTVRSAFNVSHPQPVTIHSQANTNCPF